jgi:histidyl-tRNA synthetase
MKLSNLPPKGTSDWLPDEFNKRKYIFDKWRKICLSYGFQEYLTPLVESSEIYKAKSGEDVGGSELTTFMDRGGRELAIRPEMTPSVTRMVSKVYDRLSKPIKLFSIANFYRNQRPQKGRNKEFWQLNVDIFGSNTIYADLEILKMSIDLLLELGATEKDFVVFINHRNFIKTIVKSLLNISEKNIEPAIRILDKFWKLDRVEFINRLKSECNADIVDEEFVVKVLLKDTTALKEFMHKMIDISESGADYLSQFSQLIDDADLEKYCLFDPTLVRGFDYYDGFVFEIFDRQILKQRSGESSIDVLERSLFGGGRYNGLSTIFGVTDMPAVGFAPGDETLKLFLEQKNLLPSFNTSVDIYLPILKNVPIQRVFKLSEALRLQGKNVLMGVEESNIGKSLEFCLKNGINFLIIMGTAELEKGIYKVKDLAARTEEEFIFA